MHILNFLINCLLGTVIITDVTVINPRSASVRTRQNVVIEQDRIQSVNAAGSSTLPKNAQVVDGKQKFLIPGLWDAHVHLTKTGVLSLPLFIANGVTGVRDMGSDLSQVAEWRRQIAAGQRIGPRIRTAGQISSRAQMSTA